MDLAAEGIVLIDEVEAHMHVELQRTFMRFLAKMFPNIQFIVSTHSPFVINSLDNAAIFDLDNHVFIKNGLADVSYEGIIEGYFKTDVLSETFRNKYDRYKELAGKHSLTAKEREEIPGLERYLDKAPGFLALPFVTEYRKMKLSIHNRFYTHSHK